MTSTWLVGAGAIAVAHAQVMSALTVEFTVIGRGEKSANLFTRETGIPVEMGGLMSALQKETAPTVAVIALPIEDLADAALMLIKAGTQRILIEKPGALRSDVLMKIKRSATSSECLVYIAYNRRFYASTMELSRILKEDGGVTSVFFEFNEPEALRQSVNYPENVREKWFLANSTHVVDVVFHLCGRPTEWHSWTAGELPGHPSSARFVGAGKFDSGVLFSYLSDWEAPGRWGIEIMTANHRLILRPMEKLHVMDHGSFAIREVKIDDTFDIEFKSGFFRQMEAFLSGKHEQLCSLEEHVENINFYRKMANYPR